MKQPNLIKPPPDALKKLQQERMEEIGNYLDQISNFTITENQATDLVLKAELDRNGVPDTQEGRVELLKRCVAMAKLISAERLTRYNEGVAEVCKLKNIHDLPDFVTWSAKRVGVELFPVVVDEVLAKAETN